MRPATLLSLVALLVALGGSAYAAATLGPNTVGTAQLRNGAVTSGKVKPGSLTRADVAGSALAGAPGATGPADAFSTTVSNVPMPAGGGPIANLSIPKAGAYVIVAQLVDQAVGTNLASMTCQLTAGGDVDVMRDSPSFGVQHVAVSVLTHQFGGAGAVSLTCGATSIDSQNPGANPAATATSVSIVATRVDSVTAA